MKFLFVDAVAAGTTGRALVEWIPSSIRILGGILEERGIDYEIALVENILKEPGKYADHGPFLITGFSSDLPMIGRAVGKIKGAPTLLGGPAAFGHLSELNEIPVDVAVIGEGEKTFTQLLDAGLADGKLPDSAALSEVQGIAYRSDGNLTATPAAEPLSKEEFNRFSPSTKAIEYYPFHQHVTVLLEILRGCTNFNRAKVYHGRECLEDCEICKSDDLSERLECPQGIPPGCGFCSICAYGVLKSREPDSIVKEMKGLIESGATKIMLPAPDPLDYKREELVAPKPLTDPAFPEPNYEEIEKLGDMLWDIPEVADESVSITVRDVKATLVTDRSAALLKKYFPASIFGIGGETGSEEHATFVGRPWGPEKVMEAVEIFNRNGIKPRIDFILGLPGQTKEAVEDTINLMRTLRDKVLYYDLYRFEALPGSAFDDMPSDVGPVKEEYSRRLVEEVQSGRKRFLEQFIGEKLGVVIGVYDKPEEKKGGKGPMKTGAPRRKFRQLVGVVGYPIFDKRQFSQLSTIVRVVGPTEGLKSGDVATVEITGSSVHGFRVVLEGSIVD